MRSPSLIAAALVLASAAALAQPMASHGYKPPQGYVPDEATAIKIAIAVWEPIYGRDKIAAEKPYRATLRDGVWTVEGSLNTQPGELVAGGTALAEISKSDGRILRVTHGK
jgi:hypothetical protein